MSQRSVEFAKKVKRCPSKSHAQDLIPHNAKASTRERLQRLIDRVFKP
jgi:uncharacterized protein HemY